MALLKGYLIHLLALTCLLAGMSLNTHAVPISSTSLSIDNLTLTDVQRVTRFEYDYTYTADITNSGADLFNVTGTLSSGSAAMTVLENAVDFGDVAGGATQTSSDTFKVRHNRRLGALDSSAFVWDVNFDTSPGGTPTSASLTLSNDVIPTSIAGGSTDAQCTVLDQNGNPVNPQPPVTLTTDSTTATVSGTVFAFPDGGDFQITCAVTSTAITATTAVAVLHESIDPAYSTFNIDLDNLVTSMDAAVSADAANDLAGLQAAKDALTATAGTVDLAGLAAAPPVLSDTDKPTAAELLAAGDTPNPAVDDPFKSTVQLIEQNIINANALLSGLTPATVTQADVDALDALNVTLNTLISSLPSGPFPSNTAILDVNNELNSIVSNLLPAQAVQMAQFTAGYIGTLPGITFLDWQPDPGVPYEMFAVVRPDLMNPGDFYATAENASLLPLPAVPLVWRARMFAFRTMYFPLMQYLARNTAFLASQDLLPSSPSAPVIDTVAGPSLGNLVPGSNIRVFGSDFSTTLGNNTIEVQTAIGTFIIPPILVIPDGVLGELELRGGPIPNNMCICPFGIPEPGVVRVITPGGTSNGFTVNVFP